MRKLISLVIIVLINISLIPLKSSFAEKSEENYFVVTAYYSPLPNQKYYLKGNYEAEKKLNGQGIKGASGKGVFSGMLAAPKNYAFGTKIHLEGLGIGEVADRGGAIVNAGNRGYKHDRIDVWVGYGDEGLRRALYWGKRKVKGTIINSSSKVNLNYKKIPAPSWAIPKTKQNISYNIKKIVQKTDFEIKLEKELAIFGNKLENSEETKELQEKLKNLGLYNGEIDGNYDKLINSITNYQLEKKVISKIGEAGTGYFGPKTRKSLKKDYKEYLIKEKEEQEKIKKFEEELSIFKIQSEKKADKKIKEIGKVVFGEISPRVRELQKSLIELGFFKHKDTAIFGDITKNSILEYQINNNIIENKNSKGAGYFGPATRKQLKNDLIDLYLTEQIYKNKKLSEYYQNKIENLAKNEENKKI